MYFKKMCVINKTWANWANVRKYNLDSVKVKICDAT